MPETPDGDRNKSRLKECAAACLDHIRAVRWGTATAEYSVTDDDLQIEVAISVKCYSKAKTAP